MKVFFFQEKAWCDAIIMKSWINEEWGDFFNPATPGSSGKILCTQSSTNRYGQKDVASKENNFGKPTISTTYK